MVGQILIWIITTYNGLLVIGIYMGIDVMGYIGELKHCNHPHADLDHLMLWLPLVHLQTNNSPLDDQSFTKL